jgi:response regulator RpfG family c-di-GMP phosphodiesterase
VADASAPLTVLVVDDDEAVRRILHQYLSMSGFHALEAASGRAALDLLEANRVAAVVCDIIMPGMTGIELVPIAIARDPDLAIIMLTGVDNPQSAIQCLKNGAADYLIKPVDLEELAHALQYALRKRELEIERRSLEEWLTREVVLRTRDLEEQKRQIEALSVTVLTALVEALEKPGPGGRTHSVRVANLSSHLASQLGVDSDEIQPIRIAARLHDIGQLALREDVLRETSRRTKELVGEPEGPELAARILQPLSGHAGVIEIVRRQHERWDGRGKPDGLKGDAIPLGTRIITAANLYDELTATAEAEKALRPAQALENMRGVAGMLLDPKVFDALEQMVGERR